MKIDSYDSGVFRVRSPNLHLSRATQRMDEELPAIRPVKPRAQQLPPLNSFPAPKNIL
jgi:hypothetical protein